MAGPKSQKVITLAAISCVIAIAACGSSSHSPGTASGGSSLPNVELKVSECMRSHGVSSFPDPSGAGGFNLNGSGISPVSPAFRSAQQRCFKLLPGGGPVAQSSASAMTHALQVAECMRRHAVNGFPDPTLTPPPISDRTKYSIVDDTNGAVLAVPNTINPSSPAFKQAASACGFS